MAGSGWLERARCSAARCGRHRVGGRTARRRHAGLRAMARDGAPGRRDPPLRHRGTGTDPLSAGVRPRTRRRTWRSGLPALRPRGAARRCSWSGRTTAPVPLLERVNDARKTGATILALDSDDPELDALAHESLAVPETLSFRRGPAPRLAPRARGAEPRVGARGAQDRPPPGHDSRPPSGAPDACQRRVVRMGISPHVSRLQRSSGELPAPPPLYGDVRERSASGSAGTADRRARWP